MRRITVPLRTLPLYVRANALIPTIEPPDYIADSPFDTVTFDGYLMDKGSFELRDTDGMSAVSASLAGVRLDITVEGAKRKLGLRLIRLPGISTVDAVYVNGVKSDQVESVGSDSGAHWTRDENGAVQVLIG
jgi:alpha-D-xyloside xylohydrolase